jgi:hypothetical protein
MHKVTVAEDMLHRWSHCAPMAFGLEAELSTSDMVVLADNNSSSCPQDGISWDVGILHPPLYKASAQEEM